ncbi:MAG: lysophospholipid acyltransferase family protein [Candidatus Omnitrophota bacterium]
MLFFIYNIFIFISLRVSLKRAYKIASWLGRFYSFFSFRDRHAVCDNLKAIFPSLAEDKVRLMSKEVFANFCKYLVDFFRFPLMDEAFIKENIKCEGFEHLDNALKKGRGVILVSAHLGNWELGAAVLAKLGYPLNAVVLKHRHKKIDTFFNSRRESFGVKPIPVGGALRRCFKCLSENNMLALVGDRDYFDNGVQMPFFKKKTLIPKGPAVLSMRFGSPIVPLFLIRNHNNTFLYKVYPPLEYNISGDTDRDLRRLTLAYLGILEDVIRKYPEQWYVFRRFWERIGWKL